MKSKKHKPEQIIKKLREPILPARVELTLR